MKPRTQCPVPITVKLRESIRAPRERVFRAWTSPDEILRWLVPNPGRAVSAEVDLRPGGKYRIQVLIPGGGEEDLCGVFQEVAIPSRLVYTWSHVGNPDPEMAFGETLVTVEFEEANGYTIVHLTHSSFPARALRDQFSHGWTMALTQLNNLFT